MTAPWAVEPEERSEPVAQVKPAPANVAPEPDVMPLDVIALEVMAPELAVPEVAAPELAAPEVAPPEVAAPEDAEPDVAGAAAALELLLEVVLLADGVVLLSLPQALIVRAPAASRATSPVIRVIFTQILRVSSSWKFPADRPGIPLPRRNWDVRGGG